MKGLADEYPGVPVIASPWVFSVRDAIQRHNVGVIIDGDSARDAELVRTAVQDIMSSREEWRARCTAVALNEWDWQSKAVAIQDFYETLRQPPQNRQETWE